MHTGPTINFVKEGDALPKDWIQNCVECSNFFTGRLDISG